jgi:hypothetical protein
MPDAAEVMAETINEFNTPGAESAPPAPETPPANFADDQTPAGDVQPDAAPADDGANWYESLLAEQDNDPLRALALDDQAWTGLSGDPQRLAEYAANARSYIQQQAAQREQLDAQASDIDHLGRDKVGYASRVIGDLLRGDEPISEEEALRWGQNGPRNHAELALFRLAQNQDNPRAIDELGTAVLSLMPGLLRQNEDYLLQVLGYDPKFKGDFKNVAAAGGYNPTPQQEEINTWFQTNQIPAEFAATFARLPLQKQLDMLEGNVEAAKFDLQQYHEYYAAKDQQAQQAQQAEQQRAFQVEQQATRSLADATRAIFNEYVEKGKALGLNPLEAAGAAAMAYAEIEQGYWDERSDQRRLMDGWYEKHKGGNKFQIEQGANAYKKAFEQAYRKALSQYQPKRPAPPLNNGQRPATPPANGQRPPQQQFQPAQPTGDTSALNGADLMNEIMRQYGAIR